MSGGSLDSDSSSDDSSDDDDARFFRFNKRSS